jgi:hypothetical protein
MSRQEFGEIFFFNNIFWWHSKVTFLYLGWQDLAGHFVATSRENTLPENDHFWRKSLSKFIKNALF